MSRSKSTSYKPVFYLCTLLSVVGFVCLALDITQMIMVFTAGSFPLFGTAVALFATDIWFAAQYLLHRKTAASGTTFTKTSSTVPRRIHKRNSRIAFSLIFIAIALIAPVFDIVHFQDEINSPRNKDLEAYAADLFFCSGEVASTLASSGYGELLTRCRTQRTRFILSFILILAGLAEVVCYWRTNIGTEEWASHGNSSNEDASKSVDPAFAQV